MELGVFEGTKSGIATYRTPRPEPLRRQLLNTLSGLEALRRQQPSEAAQPELARSIEQMQDLVKKGTPLKIDIATGMFVQLGSAGKQTEFHDCAWLDHVPAEEFEVGSKTWEDNTSDPAKGDLYEVDLRTGQNRRLGGELLASGFSLMPALSPDGKTVAVLHKGATGAILDLQVCLVDLESGEARTLGDLGDMAFLSWFPDGKSLLLLNREVTDPADVTSPRPDTIARLDLNGRMTKIRDGSNLQFPLDQPIPYDLIKRIVKLRVKQDNEKAEARRQK